ncbi:protein SOB FIVE-LIKE 4-like [Phragmites australis]|uniref:protein SOB FIVE-LIKE 4-like n=1 Tax=Phragmites australis TaxID=29695 RepID=UPI002D76750F|nr:protein SOB FIVE-LIKE 4-like [Phragmites australis]
MESSSHITGDDGEGCNSSESGWTMYLASPMHGDVGGGSGKGSGSEGSSVDDGYGCISDRSRSGKKAYEDYADDDSLASDASTGPAKVKAPSLQEDSKEEDEGHVKNGDGGGKEEEEKEEGDVRTKFSTSSRKKAGKVEKGEGNSSRRGHSKRGSSSRRSFFFW